MTTITTSDFTLSTKEVAQMAGVSFRIMDYCVRNGYFLPHNPKPGSGYHRQWSPLEARIAIRLGEVHQAMPSTDYSNLARCYADTLRQGNSAVVIGSWGEFTIWGVDPDE